MHIAKALVLAGRTSTDRAWPSARSVPKPLVPVANRPILFHHLDALREAGVLEATIAVEPDSARAIRSAVGDGEDWGLRVEYAECSRALGIDEALWMTGDFVADEPVLVQRVGALVRERLRPHIADFAGERIDAMGLRLRDSSHGSDDDAVDGGWLLSERAVSILMQRRRTADDFLAHVRDEDSLIRGPAIIGPRVQLRRAYVGPYTSIGPDVVIEGAEVEHSIVFAQAELRFIDSRIETSIIGQRARVTRSFAVPRALRLSIGDGAEVS